MATPIKPDTNLIDLDTPIFEKLTEILGIDERWRRLINVLPLQFRCSPTDIQYLEQGVLLQTAKAQALLQCLGNQLMTIGHLIPCLEELELDDALLLVTDFEPVRLTKDLPSYLEVPFGFNSHFSLKCKASGFPKPLYQWFKMSKSKGWDKLPEQKSNTLEIKPVLYEDDGVYICRLHNRSPHYAEQRSTIFTNEFTLKVTFEQFQDENPIQMNPPEITLHPSLPSIPAVFLGSNLTFECQAEGEKPITYEWFKNGHMITAGTSIYINDALEERSLLKIDNIQPENDEAKFTIQCQVTNPGGVTMSKELKFSLRKGPSVQFMAEDKVALLIGNGNYKNHRGLPNTKNDIIALAERLTAMDFKVLTLVNLERNEMCNAVDEFCKLLDDNVYGVFYYAGHGFQSRRRCYMVPIEANEQCSLQACISLDRIEERMQRKNPDLCCLFLDMCRNDIVCLDEDTDDSNPGQCKRNRIYAYATTNSALDGRAGGNGLFMKYLLEHISARKPLKEILDTVVEEIGLDSMASNTQIPEIAITLGRPLSLTDVIKPRDISKSTTRAAYFKQLKNPPIPNYCVQYDNVHVNIEVEPHEHVLDNELTVKLKLNRAGLDGDYSAYIEDITTSEKETVEFVQSRRTSDEQPYTNVLIYDMQKIKGHLTIDVVLCCSDGQEGNDVHFKSPPVSVPLGLPLICRACLWRQPTNLEKPPESGFHSS